MYRVEISDACGLREEVILVAPSDDTAIAIGHRYFECDQSIVRVVVRRKTGAVLEELTRECGG